MKLTVFVLFLVFRICAFAQKDTTSTEHFFSKVDHIELCELEPSEKTYTFKERWLFIPIVKSETYYFANTIINTDSLNQSRIGKRINCSVELKNEIDSLIKNGSGSKASSASCYNPRNGILYYDKNNLLIGYLEVCFECRGIAKYKFPNIIFDEKQFAALKAIFNREGLKTSDH